MSQYWYTFNIISQIIYPYEWIYFTEISSELAPEDTEYADDGVAEDEEFLEPDDIEEDLPIVEHIVAPQGKPLVEVIKAEHSKALENGLKVNKFHINME